MKLKTHPMKIKPLELLKFFFISVPIFLVVYCSAMLFIEIKDLIKRI
jgi:hypothetical protein